MSRRYTIAFADLRSGVERRVTVSAAAAHLTLAVIVTLPVLIGLGVAWRVSAEAQRVRARYHALDIERANYLAAAEALARHIDSHKESNPSGSLASAQSGPRSPSQKDAARAATGDSGATRENEQEQLSDVLIRLSETRALAEDAGAPTLASRAFQEATALERETKQLAQMGRTSDALLRALAADARFHMAESEARAEAAARERMRLASTPATRPSTAEGAADAPASPAQGGPARSLATSAAQTADAERSIRSVIAEYVSGLESRNVAALKRVWPSLAGDQERALRTEFANARTVKALFHDPRITINDDMTTVTGLRSYGVETQDGQRLSATTRTTITLRLIDDAWVIERVVHHR